MRTADEEIKAARLEGEIAGLEWARKESLKWGEYLRRSQGRRVGAIVALTPSRTFRDRIWDLKARLGEDPRLEDVA